MVGAGDTGHVVVHFSGKCFLPCLSPVLYMSQNDQRCKIEDYAKISCIPPRSTFLLFLASIFLFLIMH